MTNNDEKSIAQDNKEKEDLQRRIKASEDLPFEVNPHYIALFEDKNQHSMFSEEDLYNVLVVRGIHVNENGMYLTSRAFVISKDEKVFFFNTVKSKLMETQYSIKEIIKTIDPIFKKSQKVIDTYTKEVDIIEDKILDRHASLAFMDNWFDLKRDLALAERYFTRSYDILNEFKASYKEYQNFNTLKFRKFLTELNRTKISVTNQLSRLDALYTFYSETKNNKLNQNIYIMTVISAIFLPLNLVVGFFGMNTQNLFFDGNPEGTNIVTIILSSVIGISLFGLPILKFLNTYILRWAWGRTRLYTRFSSEIDRWESFLKGDK